MTTDGSRRFTDREVALILRNASELEESMGEGGGGGLSMAELEQIAAEVGISRALIRKAVAQMDTRGWGGFPSSAPMVHQVIRAVEGELDAEAVARLMEHVDGSSDRVGVVTEAVGMTQWTARDRFRTTQVSITPSKGETRLRVVERATARLRRLVHVVPTMTGAALIAGTIGQFDPGSGMVAAVTAVGAAVGATVGHAVWRRLSSASKARVEKLAAELTQAAKSVAPGPAHPGEEASRGE
jgi:hypothetical protein